MTDRVRNVLFLCTGNSARSILAEGILRKDGAGRFNAYSAGSQPKGKVNPFAIKVLGALGYPTDGYRSKSWDEFSRPGAPLMDFVFTVCDSAAGEACPVWPGQPDDRPLGHRGPCRGRGLRHRQGARLRAGGPVPQEPDRAFPQPAVRDARRMALRQRLRDIGRIEGSTAELLPFPGRSD